MAAMPKSPAPISAQEVEFNRQLQDRLKALRLERNWNQDFIGDFLGISGDTYSKYERRGKSLPHIFYLPRLATLYGVTCDFLLTGKGLRMVPPVEEEGKTNRKQRAAKSRRRSS